MTPLEYEAARATFAQLAGSAPRLRLSADEEMRCLDDATATTSFDRHYVYHPAWAARILAETRPAKHVDISSTLHFCATVSAFVPIDFYDYRPAALELDHLSSAAADLMALPFADRSVESISCMHTIEHIGLGRYGDPLDPDGDVKALAELARVVAPGGSLLVVVPVGAPRIVFNAHRIYGYEHVLEAVPDLELVEFALIPESAADGGLIRHADPSLVARARYACGCYWLRRPLVGTTGNSTPVASIIVTAPDGSDSAIESIESAVAQTYPETELVVVADEQGPAAGFDGVRALAEAAGVSLRVVPPGDSLTPALAANAAIRHASGEYITVLEAGDLLAPGFVAECVSALTANRSASIAFGPRLDFDASRLDYVPRLGSEESVTTQDGILRGTLFRRGVWDECSGVGLAPTACGHTAVRAPGALSFHRMPELRDSRRRDTARAASRRATAPARVSIVIPCHNYGTYLGETVASVLAQDVPLEVLIVDDGSTDDSLAVAQTLAAHDPRVSVLAQPRCGDPATARNNGIARTNAPYVLCLDADDSIQPGFLRSCVEALDSDRAVALAYGNQQNVGGNTNFVRNREYDFRFLTHQNFMSTTTVFRREAWLATGGYRPNVRYEDWDFWIGCGERGFVGRHVPAAVFNYRVGHGGRHEDAHERDAAIKARIVLNHPRLYTTGEREWARAVESGAQLGPTPLGVIPTIPPTRFVDPGRLVVAASADELAAHRDLLVQLDRCAPPEATLLLHVDSREALDALAPDAQRLALEVLAVPDASEADVALQSHAVLSSGWPGPLLSLLPRFELGEAAA